MVNYTENQNYIKTICNNTPNGATNSKIIKAKKTTKQYKIIRLDIIAVKYGKLHRKYKIDAKCNPSHC